MMTRNALALTVAKITFPIAVVALLAAVIIESATGSLGGFLLLIPAGALLALRGVLMLSQPTTVLRALADDESQRSWGKAGFRIEHRGGAVLLILIGIGWAAMGIAQGGAS